MGKIVAVITVDDNICGSCPLRECNRCMYFHKQLHKNIEAGYLRCVTCKQAEVREPKAEVKVCEWIDIDSEVWKTSCGNTIYQTMEGLSLSEMEYCVKCGKKIKEVAK